MRVPWLSREYERTCAGCGYSWRVPRSAARRRVGKISKVLVSTRGRQLDRGELARQVRVISARNAHAATLRNCPRCGAGTFDQHPARGAGPAGYPGPQQW